jgi:gamma-glutamyl:cysteine ligase YbdK (ATP-grasp superfamily)
MYGTLQVLGPEHEFSIVDEKLQPQPIVDKVIKDLHGRISNTVSLGDVSLGKELQAHVTEFKANTPFDSPVVFEETMHKSVLSILDLLGRRYKARLLGLGMHPMLQLENAKVWTHRDRSLYQALNRIFSLNQHGWLNIQSFQLNLPFKNEREAVKLYNDVANILPFLPAISASSPIYESKIGDYRDNRLHFYAVNQAAVPSITGDIIPERVHSFEEYKKTTIRRYSEDLAKVNAPKSLLNKEWLNSRGAVIRFCRKAIEIRIMDEQECIKSDVALSCFIRALLRGILQGEGEDFEHVPHAVLVRNLHAVIRQGLDAHVRHPKGETARKVCKHLFTIAEKNASVEEKKYLETVKCRIAEGNLSDLILKEVHRKASRTDLSEAIFSVYSSLADCLEQNRVYT